VKIPYRALFGALTVVALASLATAACAPAATSSARVMYRHRTHTGQQESLNWAGYIRAGHALTQIAATWKVPTLQSSVAGYSSTWVGIDGATSTDRYLIQTGTEADVSYGRRLYHAWWEVITPTNVAPETLFSTLAVHPGDSVTASVARGSNGLWTMQIRDNTTHASAAHTAKFGGPGATAEWIQEDTDVDGYISAAPRWGKVGFSGLQLNRANPHLLAGEAVDIVDRHGTRETSTSKPSASGSGFSVTWLAAGTRTRVA
jgi:hypothetical protein